MRMMVIPIIIGALGMVPKILKNDTGGTENHRKNQDHPDYRIVKNTQKSTGDLRRFACTQKDQQLKLV